MSLLRAIEICLNATNIPPSHFGRDSVRDPRLVHDLRMGRQPGRRMVHRVQNHMRGLIAALPEQERQKTQRQLRQSGGFPCA